MQAPRLADITITEESLTETSGCAFVTIFLNGEVRGSAGNVKEIHGSLAEEIIASTVAALKEDTRFAPLTLEESEKIQFRVDTISSREIISLKDIDSLDPVKQGMIVIHRDYEKLAVVLPNISAKLLTGKDFIPVLQEKLSEKKLDDKNCIFYKIETKQEQSF